MKEVRVVDDKATGRAAKTVRLLKGIPLREMAEKMECTVPFLWYLENGKRSWSKKWIDRFNNAIKEIGEKQ